MKQYAGEAEMMTVTETNDLSITMAGRDDLPAILNLQKMAYPIEAARYPTDPMPPLTETLAELQAAAARGMILNAVVSGGIVGSVRAYVRDGTCYIGRLVVHPDYQNRGIGRQLLAAIEQHYAGKRYELFTGHLSAKNLALYERLGYRRFKTETVSDTLKLVYLEKL